MDILTGGSLLRGELSIPASKSCAHRALICASLAEGRSVISGVTMSKDIEATIGAMTALGASFSVEESTITVDGISEVPEKALIDCCESGSTLRFVLPIAAALGIESVFSGRGRLPQRPIDIYFRELGRNGADFHSRTMPYIISGKLRGERYEVEGNVSSQFVTGLLFALPLLGEDSEIILTSHLESRPYVEITLDMLSRFGISIEKTYNSFRIKGGQKYKPHDETIEGDYSQAAFFFVANALGSDVKINNLLPDSVQGDRRITDIIASASKNGTVSGFRADCSDIPDLVPILAVLGAFGAEESVIYNAERLRIKESDRLSATADMLNALGGDVTVTQDGLVIRPTGSMHGGSIDSVGDHRIAMAAAIAATRISEDVVIKGAEAVEKSYPGFFRDYAKLGGKANVIVLE